MAYAEIEGARIRVQTAWNEKELIKQVPGARWSTQEKAWYINKNWASCVTLQGVFGPALTMGENLLKWGWEKRKKYEHMIEMRTWTEPIGWEPEDKRLYPFQAVGARFLRRTMSCLLGDEMGTGKTIQVLAAFAEMGSVLFNDALPALIVCPNSVKTNWAKEAALWLPYANPYVVTGSPANRAKIIQSAAKDPMALIIVNYEALRALTRLAPYGSTRLSKCRTCDPKGEETVTAARCQVHPKELNKIGFRAVVIDEAHRIKNPQSQQTRAAWAVMHGTEVRSRFALTGTPLANDPGDLWGILHGIAPLEFPTKTGYVDRYCLQSWNAFGGLSIVGLNPANKAEFYKIFDPHFRRMPKDLVLAQLPPKVRMTRWVELSPTQKKMYKQFQDGLVAETEGGNLVAPDGLIARMRQMQIASATPHVDGYEGLKPIVSMHEPSTKLDELEAVLEELGPKPVAICCEQYKLLALAEKRLQKLKISYGVIAGPVSEYERDLALRNFQEGKLQVLLFTIQAGGTGLTMTAADTIIFLQRSWSMIANKQAEDRVHRIGSERHESICIIDIVARDTVEEGQIKSLTEKFMRLQEIARDRATIMAAGGSVEDLDREEAIILGSEL